MSDAFHAILFLIYGLAFVMMGFIVLLEHVRANDERLRHALRPLIIFGLLHGGHEWLEMLERPGLLPWQADFPELWEAIRLGLLAFSFLSLTAFGASLLSPNANIRRISLLGPLLQGGIWAGGLLVMRGRYPADALWDGADVWTRYVLGIPAALVASVGLVAQQRAFRRAGMEQFGRDSLWAAIAFAWYGLMGRLLTRASQLPPSTFLNQDLFFRFFGFPVQLLRAAAAVAISFFIVGSLRSFEVETQRRITQLQEDRLREAEKREALRGDLLRRVVAAQEAERQRIARELHDETGQELTALGLGLRGVSRMLGANHELAAHNLHQLENLVARSLDELQRLIANLRPSHLDDLGLPAALRWWAGETQKVAGITVTVTVAGTEHPLASPVKIALFRIAQEALTNVIKHAQAQNVAITLTYSGADVRIEVQDDGWGFDVERAMSDERRQSWGLLGMRERASLLGGEFTLDSHPGRGTRIAVVIPCQTNWSIPEQGAQENGHTPAAGG